MIGCHFFVGFTQLVNMISAAASKTAGHLISCKIRLLTAPEFRNASGSTESPAAAISPEDAGRSP